MEYTGDINKLQRYRNWKDGGYVRLLAYNHGDCKFVLEKSRYIYTDRAGFYTPVFDEKGSC